MKSPRLQAWNNYVELVNVHRERDGSPCFDANDSTYTVLMAGFYIGFDAGAERMKLRITSEVHGIPSYGSSPADNHFDLPGEADKTVVMETILGVKL